MNPHIYHVDWHVCTALANVPGPRGAAYHATSQPFRDCMAIEWVQN